MRKLIILVVRVCVRDGCGRGCNEFAGRVQYHHGSFSFNRNSHNFLDIVKAAAGRDTLGCKLREGCHCERFSGIVLATSNKTQDYLACWTRTRHDFSLTFHSVQRACKAATVIHMRVWITNIIMVHVGKCCNKTKSSCLLPWTWVLLFPLQSQ